MNRVRGVRPWCRLALANNARKAEQSQCEGHSRGITRCRRPAASRWRGRARAREGGHAAQWQSFWQSSMDVCSSSALEWAAPLSQPQRTTTPAEGPGGESGDARKDTATLVAVCGGRLHR